MAAYDYSDPMLDFDDANDFLSMLLTTVPSLERTQKWDLTPAETHKLLFDNFDQLSNDVVASSNSDLATDFMNPQFPELSTASGPQLIDDVPRMLSLSLGSYSDLIGSHFGVSTDGTPNTSISLPHTLPGAGNIKNEFALPYFAEVSPAGALGSASLAESEIDPAEQDVISPKLKIVSKDKVSKPAKKAKVSHNMIEKKYRTNINSKILELRDAVPTLRIATGKANVLVAELEGLLPASKLNKASVLTKATEYIRHLERKNDVMLQQIAQLQSLIHDSNVNPPQQMMRDIPANNAEGNNFAFNSQSFDGVNDFGLYNSAPMSARPSQENMNSNMMLGGLTTVMGSSLISGENFRGLAAIPFVPTALTSPSPLTLQLLSVLRTAVFVAGVAMMVTPVVKSFRRSEKASPGNSLFTWLAVSLGLYLPKPLSAKDEDLVIAHLLGTQPCTSLDLVADFTTLNTSEVSFENSFLYVLVGALLVKKYPLFSRVIKLNLRWRAALLMNLDYTGEDANLKKLNKLIKTLDGLSLFDSERLITRLNNLSTGKPVNDGLNNGENYLNYVEIYLRDKTDIYGLIFKWRVLEIVHELNLTYLNVFVKDAGKRDETVGEIKEDIKKIDTLLLGDEGILTQYFTLFKCVLFPESTPELLKSMKSEIIAGLAKVTSVVDGAELTDDESISEDDSSDAGEDKETSTTASTTVPTDPLFEILNQKSMVYSMNLVNEEKFIVLATSLISYYSESHRASKSLDLLRYLKFNTSKVPLSMLSFTCLVKLLCNVIRLEDDESEEEDGKDSTEETSVTAGNSAVLESLVKLTKGWLNDDGRKNCMTHKLRGDLSDLVMAKGIALNEI